MIKTIFDIISLWIIPAIVLIVLFVGIIKKLPIYELFVDGAKDGAKVGINIFPYLLAIMVAISMFRASGMIDFLSNNLTAFFDTIHTPVDVLPIMIVRSLSGSAVLGVLSDIMYNFISVKAFWNFIGFYFIRCNFQPCIQSFYS